jgi:hypothetical protein
MRVATTALLAGMLLTWSSSAHAQAGAQSSTSANSTTSAEANRSGAQASSNTAASTSAPAAQNSADLGTGTSMNAALSQPIDAKKNRPGDPVYAKTTEPTKSQGKVVLPKGTKLVGHITEAKARASGESESAVGIVFDKAILKNGQEVPLNTSVRALAAAQTAASGSAGADDLEAGGAIGGGAAGGGRAAAGGALGGVRSTAGATNWNRNKHGSAHGRSRNWRGWRPEFGGQRCRRQPRRDRRPEHRRSAHLQQPRRLRFARNQLELRGRYQHARLIDYVDEQKCAPR